MSFRNEYDGHTIESSLEQVERLTGRKIKLLAGDRGYRGKKEINGTKIMIPDVPKKSDSRYQRLKKHMLFCKRAGIEPTIGHLKSDYRLGRNFYKGVVGDAVNVLLSAKTYNFKRAMKALLGMLQKICEILCLNNISQKWAFKGRLNKNPQFVFYMNPKHYLCSRNGSYLYTIKGNAVRIGDSTPAVISVETVHYVTAKFCTSAGRRTRGGISQKTCHFFYSINFHRFRELKQRVEMMPTFDFSKD